jgi:hypothetical protein
MLHLLANVRDETSEDYNSLEIIGEKHSQSQTSLGEYQKIENQAKV